VRGSSVQKGSFCDRGRVLSGRQPRRFGGKGMEISVERRPRTERRNEKNKNVLKKKSREGKATGANGHECVKKESGVILIENAKS